MTYNDGRLKSVNHPDYPNDPDVDPMVQFKEVQQHPSLVEVTIYGPKHGTKGIVRVDKWQLLQALGLNITPPKTEPIDRADIAQVMGEHIYVSRDAKCGCGKQYVFFGASYAEQHRAHVAQKIAEATQ